MLFSDEKLFTIESAFNHQNDRTWSQNPPEKESRIVSRQIKPKSVMVWGAVGYNAKIPLVFVEKGVKLNAEVYCHLLEENFLPWARQHYGDEPWIFQQDGAPSHTAKSTQEWCARNFRDFIRKDEWAPASCDMNVMDYSIWGILENDACAEAHSTVEGLKNSLLAAWERLDQEVINRAVDDFPRRLNEVIAAEGGHFE